MTLDICTPIKVELEYKGAQGLKRDICVQTQSLYL